MADDRVEGTTDRPMPLQSPGVRPALHPHAQLDVMPHQVAEHGADRAEFVELVEDQPDDVLDLLVGVQGDPVAGQPDVAGGNDGEQLTAAGLVQPPVREPLLQEVQLGLAHGPFQPQQQPIVVQGRVVDAVLVGQQGVENRAPLQKMIPVGVGPGQSTDLEAKDDSDVIEVHLGQEPLEAQSAVGGGAGFSLIVGDDDHPVGWPAPGDGEVAEAGLDFSRLFIVHYLIRTGLADIDDGQPFEVPGLDLRGSRWRADRLRVRPGQQAGLVRGEERVRCDHDRPPARRRREVFGAGVGAGFGPREGDSARTDWTKDGPAGPDAIGSPWVLTGGDSGVGTALHGTPP